MFKYKTAAIALIALILFTGCAHDKSSRKEESPELPPGVEAQLVLPDSAFALGEPVTMTLVVKHEGNKPVRLTFPTACKVDFLVSREGVPIWNSLHDVGCAQMMSHSVLSPGDSIVMSKTWNGEATGEKGVVVLGEYVVKGLLLSDPPIESPPASFYLVD